MSSSPVISKYGEWKSQINSEFIIGGNCKSVCELQARNGHAFWIEQTFPKGHRVCFQGGSSTEGSVIRWSADGISCTNSVHEYGGGSMCVSDELESLFICQRDGGLFELSSPLAEPRPIVSIEKVRHADIFVHGDFIYAVQERHEDSEPGAEPINLLVRANIKTGAVEVVAEGADFYAEPRVSPNGELLVWMQWNKPNMPWDETSVHLRDISKDGKLGAPKQLLSGGSFMGLQWGKNVDEPVLYVISDSTGYWNVYEVDVSAGTLKENVYPISKDIGGPLWQFADDRPFAVCETGIVLAVGENLVYKPMDSTKQVAPIESVKQAGFTVFSFLTISANKLFTVATGPTRALSVIEVDLSTFEVKVVRETRSSEEIKNLTLSVPQSKWFDSDGVQVEGYFYPPANPDHVGLERSVPPVIFLAHPGPTAQTSNGLNFKIQYFTSRGFAVFDINYRGSTGYGREFRNLLLGNWGVVDTNDMINGAKYLIENQLVDPKKICIMGSSAGGFLVLSTLFHPENVFSAAVSIYGVTDLEDIFKSSHKFESDYTVRLVAPYPEGIEVYKQRSAIHNIDKINTPVAFIHGLDDPVVPYTQSEFCYEKLKERGIKSALKLFPGESHGFKSAEAVTKSLDMSYFFFCRVLGLRPSVDSDLEIVN